jgi:hypothetical protein
MSSPTHANTCQEDKNFSQYTSVMSAIINDHEAAAEALIAATASAGALNVQVGGRGQGGLIGCMEGQDGAGMEHGHRGMGRSQGGRRRR